jgi:hypothetical protein
MVDGSEDSDVLVQEEGVVIVAEERRMATERIGVGGEWVRVSNPWKRAHFAGLQTCA